MFNTYNWDTVEGKGKAENLTLLSLSTCGFCHSARQYLEDRGLAFRYLELDTIPAEDKSELKIEFRNKFGRRPSFPTLIINEERFLIGFIRNHWDEEIE